MKEHSCEVIFKIHFTGEDYMFFLLLFIFSCGGQLIQRSETILAISVKGHIT